VTDANDAPKQASTDASPTSTASRADRRADKKAARAERRRAGGEKVKAGTNAVRSRIASVVWLLAVLAALFLAVGALLVALTMNEQNAIVKFVLDVAKAIDLGVFKDYSGKGAATKEALTNWGIAAVIYLVIGKVLDRIIRP
jgi:uncharacterized membrane protein